MTIHPSRLADSKLQERCTIRRQRRSAPGGQHRNKVETGIIIEHLPTGVRGVATERRSQATNRRVALHRLRIQLAIRLRSAELTDRDTLPSELWRSRCGGGRIAINTEHADFPPLLAEAMDAIQARSFDVAAAAQLLGTTASQLVKLLRRVPAALETVNCGRRSQGLRSLR